MTCCIFLDKYGRLAIRISTLTCMDLSDPSVPKPAIIYARESQGKDDEELSTARQVELSRELIKKNEHAGYRLVREQPFKDESISATSLKHRPGWIAALEMLRSGRAKVIVAVDLDRLSRHPTDIEELIKVCEEAGGAVRLVSGELDLTSTDGQLNARILVAVAAAEVRRKGERHRRANHQKALAGGKTKGVRPFGFNDDKLTINEREAAALRASAEAFVAGASFGSIARTWRALGFKPAQFRKDKDGVKRQGEWSVSGVRRVLENQRYIGKRVYIPTKNGKKLADQKMVTDAQWPAILPDELFAAVQARIADPDRLASTGHKLVGKPAPSTLLASTGECGLCFKERGGTARGDKRSNDVKTYSCRKCSGWSIRRDFADAIVAEAVIAWADRREVPSLEPDDSESTIDTYAAQLQIDELRRRRKGTSAQIAQGLDPAVAQDAIRLIDEEIASIEASIGGVEEPIALRGLAEAKSGEEWWESLTLAGQRRAVQYILRVTMHPRGRGYSGHVPEQVQTEYIR